ncbi:MAG TPA: hypothetical protein VED47_03010 [Burkholderiaceae bacterium]|nr:hypothetical protein [Burkholderiaceae bacterium]
MITPAFMASSAGLSSESWDRSRAPASWSCTELHPKAYYLELTSKRVQDVTVRWEEASIQEQT